MPFLNTEMAAFLRERFEKDLHYFRVYDTYTPNFNSKIYHDQVYLLVVMQGQSCRNYADYQVLLKI
jgi:hypothetical protein